MQTCEDLNMTKTTYKVRSIRESLAQHYARMKELEAQGMTREAASQQAYEEMIAEKRGEKRP
jgi:hypothetical protein